MGKVLKVALAVSAVLISIGIITAVVGVILITTNVIKPDFSRTVENKYDVEEDFSDLYVSTVSSDVKILPSDDGTTYVKTKDRDKISHEVKVDDGKLSVELIDSRAWYDHIIPFFGNTVIEIYLSGENYSQLDINATTGNALVSECFTFEKGIFIEQTTGNIDLKCDSQGDTKLTITTGSVDLNGVDTKSLEITTSTGSMKLEGVNTDSLDINTTTGSVKLEGVNTDSLDINTTTGSIRVNNSYCKNTTKIETSTGSVRLDRFDSKDIFIETTTGSVHGKLMSAKVFDVDTTTGSIDIPENGEGGTCYIRCTTGSVNISIAE